MIIIIDDETDIQELLLEVMASEGIEAAVVAPHDAVDSLRDLAPTVVLLDVVMPGVDGYELLRRLRSVPEVCDSYVLLLTSRSRLEDLEHGFECGADDYVTKPFDVNELVARVRRGIRATEHARGGASFRERAS
ncbi:MAG: response regulator [Chloroflexia bacterium]